MSGTLIGRHRSNAVIQPQPPGFGRARANARAKKPVVFAGHGSFNTITDAATPKVRLPPDITMVFWCHHGEELINSIGMFVEARRPLSELPDHLQKAAAASGYDPTGIPEIVPGGSEIWNYRLTYPKGLDLANAPATYTQPPSIGPVQNPSTVSSHFTTTAVIKDNSYCIVGPWEGTDVGARGLPILAMINANRDACTDNIVHWCACRSIMDR